MICDICKITLKGLPIQTVCNICEDSIKCDDDGVLTAEGHANLVAAMEDALSRPTVLARVAAAIVSRDILS